MISRREALMAASGAAFAQAPAKPNVILAMADDQGWADTSYNGHPVLKTPNLDAMARSGIRFTRFYSGAPVCSPTRASCLTGRHPYRPGIFFANADNGDGPSKYALPARELTLAEMLREQGYRTGHFGKWHLGDFAGEKKSSPSDNGFDEWFSTVRKTATLDPAGYFHNGKPVGPLKGDDSGLLMDRALPFIESAVKARQPFFAVIWFHAPHLPVLASEEDRRPFAAHGLKQQHYWGALAALDRAMGRLRAALRTLGVARDTMLWYASDNGPEGDQEDADWPGKAKPLRGRKRSLFEGGVRVPGLLEWPARIKPGKAVGMACSTSDYLPTIASYLNLPAPAVTLDGISLRETLEGARMARPQPIAFQTVGNTRGSPRYALIDNRFKLLTNLDSAPDLLFDLIADPAESADLAAQQAATVQSMKQTLRQWRDSCRADYGKDDYPL